MKIVPASFKILDHLDQKSLAVRIEECGRICYKSEDCITPDSALPFIKNVIERGHNSVLEMGVVTLEVVCDYRGYINLIKTIPKYLHLTDIEPEGPCWLTPESKSRLLITGSIRAWREMLINHPDCAVVQAACALLFLRNPYFFSDILPEDGGLSMPNISVRKVPLEEVDGLPTDLLVKHRHIAVKFIVNRAVSHEICRHRAMAMLMASQRYCNYASGKFGRELAFIRPSAFFSNSNLCETCGLVDRINFNAGYIGCPCTDESKADPDMSIAKRFAEWLRQCESAERAYLVMIDKGASPQEARTVLPNSCKTELIVYANLEQWKHIFKLRCSKAAEPSMREVMIPLREEFTKRWPEVFGGALSTEKGDQNDDSRL